MITYEEFKTTIKKQVLKALAMTEKQFVTNGFIKIIQCKTDERSEKTLICYNLMKANEYSVDEILDFMPACFANEKYAYEREFIDDISQAINPYKKRSEEEMFDMIIEAHISQFLQGVKDTCFTQQEVNDYKINDEIVEFSFKYGTYKNRSRFTYLDDSASSLSKLKDFNEFTNFLVNEIVDFSKKYNFYLFSEIENLELKEKVKIENMRNEITLFLNSLSTKTKGIELLEEILAENK